MMAMIVVIGNQQLVFYVSLVSQNAAQFNPLWDIPLTSNTFLILQTLSSKLIQFVQR